MHFRNVYATVCLMLAAGLTCQSEAAGGGKIYNHLVIKAFDTPEGTELPPDFAQMLRRNLKLQLGKTNRFREITVVEKSDPVPANADLELTGKITRFKDGSPAKGSRPRPGLGATLLDAIVEFKELPGGQTLYKSDVSGIALGVGGGDSLDATDRLAKNVAKIVNKKMR